MESAQAFLDSSVCLSSQTYFQSATSVAMPLKNLPGMSTSAPATGPSSKSSHTGTRRSGPCWIPHHCRRCLLRLSASLKKPFPLLDLAFGTGPVCAGYSCAVEASRKNDNRQTTARKQHVGIAMADTGSSGSTSTSKYSWAAAQQTGENEFQLPYGFARGRLLREASRCRDAGGRACNRTCSKRCATAYSLFLIFEHGDAEPKPEGFLEPEATAWYPCIVTGVPEL